MNNIFNFRRFGLLMKKTFYEKGFVIAGAIILLIALMLLTYSTLESVRNSSFAQNLCFVLGLLSSTVIVNILMNNFSKKSSTISFMTLPCSHFEKWLMVFVITCFIFLPIFLVIFKIIDAAFINHYREIATSKFSYSAKQLEQDLPYIRYSFGDNNNRVSFAGFLACFVGFGGIFTSGSLYFNQKSYIKTALVLLFGFIALRFIGNNLFSLIIGEQTDVNLIEFSKAFVTNANKSRFSVSAVHSLGNIIRYFMLLFIPATLWLISLIRFGDKEL